MVDVFSINPSTLFDSLLTSVFGTFGLIEGRDGAVRYNLRLGLCGRDDGAAEDGALHVLGYPAC